MKNFLATLIFTFCIAVSCTSAQFLITTHEAPTFHDNPLNIDFAEDQDGNIWLLQRGSFAGDIIHRYMDGNWERIPFTACSNCTYQLANDSNGVIYLSTNTALFIWDGDEWILNSEDIFNNGNIEFDNNNNLWFTSSLSFSEEVVKYRSPSGDITDINEVFGQVSKLTVGPTNSVWFKNSQEVVEIKSDGSINRFDINVSNLAVDKNNVLWFTDFGGDVGKIENGVINEDILPEVDNGFQVLSFAIDRNNDFFWLGNQGIDPGIMFWDGMEATLIPGDDLFTDIVVIIESMYVSSNGTLWAGSRPYMPVVEVRPMLLNTADLYEEVNIFPNPVIDMLYLNLDDQSFSPKAQIEIYDYLGRLVKKENLPSTQNTLEVNVGNLNSGIYHVIIPELSLRSSFIKN